MTPYIVKQVKEGRNIPVPCGKCPDCLKRRVSNWSFRLMQHEKTAETAFFLTLTFDTDHVPITHAGYMTLDKKILQDFFKRLRYWQPDSNIKYYAVGEYGGKTKRPHYHVIIFNAQISNIIKAWTKDEKPIGNVHFGKVSGASVGYTLKYMTKKSRIPEHKNDDRLPEFSLMSKGLGANYLTDEMKQWHEADINHRMYCNAEGGKKISMPRYYKDKIYTKEQQEHIAAHLASKHLERYEAHQKMMLEKHGENAQKVQVEIDQLKFQKMYQNAEKNRNQI